MSQVAISSLKGDYAFRRLRRGRAGHTKLLSLRWLRGQAGVRAGIVVSKKVGKAVVRNRVRRRLLEALKSILRERESLDARLDTRGADLVIIARPAAATANYWQLKAALASALEKGAFL
jgi:ribonuclease P protein component